MTLIRQFRDSERMAEVLRFILFGGLLGGLFSLTLLALMWRQAQHPAATVPVQVANVALEPLPAGMAIAVVLLDREGRDAAMHGRLTVRVQTADGEDLEEVRHVAPGDFAPLPGTSALPGRRGYRLLVPSSAWIRPPQPGTAADVVLMVAPRHGQPFTHRAVAKFP